MNRRYQLRLYGNTTKTDTARYTQKRFNDYANMFLGRIYFGERRISTAGMGDLANRAAHRSHKIIKALRASEKATKNKTNVPFARKLGCNAKIEMSKNSRFDYWVRVLNQWGKEVFIPAKSHGKLNEALRAGWKMSGVCEFKIINSNPYAIVFVSKEAPKIKRPKTTIGCDVGYKYSVCTSEGHIGQNVSKVIRRSKEIQSERQRQGHKISSKVKSRIKQILDHEAKLVLGRSKRTGARLVVEDPKRLAGLSTGRLHGWARGYFANRIAVLGKENGIEVLTVNPYQTSITCSKCGVVDKQSRDKQAFVCTSCGHTDHADLNAAKNIALKGTQNIRVGNLCRGAQPAKFTLAEIRKEGE